MAKTQEELKELKEEYESLNLKLNELTDDEMKQVTGGLCEYRSLEKDTCFENGKNTRYVLPEDYPNITWSTNFYVDCYRLNKNGVWEYEKQELIAQNILFGYPCIGKWRP